MKFILKYAIIVLFLLTGPAETSVLDFQKMHQEEQQKFVEQMQHALQKSVGNSSLEVQRLYKEINYQPIWVDKDYLSQYAELFLHELHEDMIYGKHPKLEAAYKKLLPDEQHIFRSDSLKARVEIELGIMQLYVDHINDILKEKKSRYTPLSLLKFALKEKSLISALDTISKERISYRTSLVDQNSTFFKEGRKIDRKSMEQLVKGDGKERLKAMYKLIGYQPVWINRKGLSSYSKELFEQIEKDITVDKNSTVYTTMLRLKKRDIPKDDQKIVAYEFELAKLYQDYISHALYGNIDWKAFQSRLRTKKNACWVVHQILTSPEALLIEALGRGSLKYAFEKSKPQFPLYDKMLEALKKYQAIAASGGWGKLPEFKDLKPGMHNPVVPLLRDRLAKEGDYLSCGEDNGSDLYGPCLVDAVKRFQKRHGLESKGYIGKMTRKALAESASHKVARIKLNLDRMKWIKRSHDRYHIWVNIPGYMMYLYDNGKLLEAMKVIVGRQHHNTPVFYNRVRTIVLNPYWRIPPSIIRHELVPKLQKDPHYTNRKKIEIHTGYSEHSPRVNPLSVDWHKYGHRLPPYKFMQSPGKENALGKIKYLFPNRYSVYMHDTNEPYLFVKDVRALSHGCVRLHKPVDLLKKFSQIDPKIDFKKSQQILKENQKTPIRLSHTVPIDIIYLTSWVEGNTTVHFRNDIYGYDKMQLSTSK